MRWFLLGTMTIPHKTDFLFTFLILLKVKLAPSSSRDFPLVSGIIKITKRSCSTIINAKKENTKPAPIVENRKGTMAGIIAANIQWTETPKDCPDALK